MSAGTCSVSRRVDRQRAGDVADRALLDREGGRGLGGVGREPLHVRRRIDPPERSTVVRAGVDEVLDQLDVGRGVARRKDDEDVPHRRRQDHPGPGRGVGGCPSERDRPTELHRGQHRGIRDDGVLDGHLDGRARAVEGKGGDLVDDVHPLLDVAEDRVLPVEVRGVTQDDGEAPSPVVGLAVVVRHRQHPGDMVQPGLPLERNRLGLDGLLRGRQRRRALQGVHLGDVAGHDPEEVHAVEHSGTRHGEDVGDGLRRDVGIEPEDHVPGVGLQHDAVGADDGRRRGVRVRRCRAAAHRAEHHRDRGDPPAHGLHAVGGAHATVATASAGDGTGSPARPEVSWRHVVIVGDWTRGFLSFQMTPSTKKWWSCTTVRITASLNPYD